MCTKPLKGFKYGKTRTGKDNYIIGSYNIDHVEINSNGIPIKCFTRGISSNSRCVISEYIEIPCGQCIECRLEYSRQWANRCMLESQQYKDNCFITLTYDDEHLPLNDSVRSDTGELVKVNTLRKRDLQLFIKRLRKMLGDQKIRYFACGEYGDQTKRPHYHLIIFNWKPDLLTPVSYNQDLNYSLYSSKEIESCWPFGHNIVGECTWETCAYVARYVVKKIKGFDSKFYEVNNIDPEFVLMSRRPGIGNEWLSTHKKCYATFLNNYINTPFGSRTISHNKYFDKLIEVDDQFKDIHLLNKENRKEFAKEKKKIKLSNTSLPYLEALQVEEENASNRTKALSRKDI